MDKLLTQIKGYELRERIGTGGFGAVYKAYQSTIGREVAIKIILPGLANQPDFIRRFESEAQLVARLEHPHITPLYDYWRDPEGAYLVMRWLRGGSLRDSLQSGAFELRAAALLLDQIAGALSLAHRNGVIHRDIKPANILLDEDGNAYLTDFGIAKDLNLPTNHTQHDAIIGSLDYISPEQARSEPVTPRTDIYSLGVTLYEIITGNHPFENMSSVERLYKHINEPLPEIITLEPDVQEAVNRVIQTATAKNPRYRYPDALALAADFREALGMRRTSTTIEELLTQREHEILHLIIEGLANKEIAQRLTLTLGTVKWHVNQIYSKLGVRSRVQAIVRARELHLIVKPGEAAESLPIPTEDFYPQNPYKGLLAFQAADYQDFFGREKVTAKLVKRLSESGEKGRFLAVVGPSGSGKSSLVKAGLIPALWRGDLPGSEKWFILEMLPGAHPLDELEVALTRIAANQTGNLNEHLRRDSRGLIRAAGLILPNDGSELVLVIDQFEELFTLVEDEQARVYFLDLLHAAVTEPHSRVRVVITLRADFYDRPLHYSQFGELVHTQLETIMPLSAEELERAIAQPAERVGAIFEPGLVAAIIGDVNYQPGALPLLQYALTELFEQRKGRLLTREAYQEIGGTVGALAKRAEEVYLNLGEADQETTRQLFLRLVTLGEGTEDTRRRTARSELQAIAADGDVIDEIIDTFAAYRLLSLDIDPASRTPTVEVAHEALLHQWERLRAWLNDSRDEIRVQRQLSSMAEEWRHASKDTSFLASGSRLDQFEKWAADTRLILTQRERDYLSASLAERARQTEAEFARQAKEQRLERRSQNFLRGLVAVLLLATLGAFGLTGAAVANANEAQRAAAVSRSLALASDSKLALNANNNDLALILSMAAVNIDNPPARAELALSEAAYAPGSLWHLKPYSGTPSSMAISPDGRYAAVGLGRFWSDQPYEEDNTIRLIDLLTKEEVRRFEGHADGVWQLDFSKDGKYLLSGAADIVSGSHTSTIILWDVATGQAIRNFAVDEGVIGGLAFDPDGLSFVSMVLDDSNPFVSIFAAEQGICQWNIESGERIRCLPDDIGPLYTPTLSPNGRYVVAKMADMQGDPSKIAVVVIDFATDEMVQNLRIDGGMDAAGGPVISTNNRTALFLGPTIVAWDIETGEQITEQANGFLSVVNNFSNFTLSPDGKTFAIASQSGEIQLFDVETWQKLDYFKIPVGSINALAFTPDNQNLVTAATGGMRVWDFRSGALVWQFDAPGIEHWASRFKNVSFMPDGRSVLMLREGDGTLFIRNLETGEITQNIQHGLGTWGMDVTPDGRAALIGAFDIGSAMLYDLTSGEIIRQFVHVPDVTSFYNMVDIDISPDGRMALTGAQGLSDGMALWNLETGEMLHRFEPADGTRAVLSAAYDPAGNMGLAGLMDGTMMLYDLQTYEEIRPFGRAGVEHTGPLFDVAFSPDGRTILSASSDGTLILWDVETGRLVDRFVGHSSEVRAVAFSPDGKLAASGSSDSTIMIWDVASGQAIRRYVWPRASRVLSIAFSPDGQMVLAGGANNVVSLWRIDSSLDDLIAWTTTNRFVPEPSCIQRELYNLTPLCETAP